MCLSQDLWVVHLAEYFLQGYYQATATTASLNNPVKITSNTLIKNIFSIKQIVLKLPVADMTDVTNACSTHMGLRQQHTSV